MSKPSHTELDDQIAAFLLKGGTINQIDEGQSALNKEKVYDKFSEQDDSLDDYTERSMRSAENQDGVESAYYGR